MNERLGIWAAILSSTFGGMAAAATRFVVGDVDPVTLAAFRFGGGVLFLLPIALALRCRWPRGRDWLGVAGLGLMFFAGFFVIYNLALGFTTAARGSLALSVLPLATMVVGALLGIEPLTTRKTTGVLIARRRRRRGARGRRRRRAARRLARRRHHDRRHAVHGAL